MTISFTKEDKINTDNQHYWFVNDPIITSTEPNIVTEEEYAFPYDYTDQQINDYIVTDLINKGYNGGA
jgi:hypothetical protein